MRSLAQNVPGNNRVGWTPAKILYAAVPACIIVGIFSTNMLFGFPKLQATSTQQSEPPTERPVVPGAICPDATQMKKKAAIRLLDRSAVRKLKVSPEMDVALIAAWEEVVRTLPQRGKDPRPIDSRALNRFLGFLEGRVKTTVPSWWEGVLLRAEGINWENQIFEEPKDFPLDNTSLGLRAPINTRFEDKGENILIRMGQALVTIPTARVKGLARRAQDPELIAAHISGKRCCLAMFNTSNATYDIHLVEDGSGRIVWTGKVMEKISPPGGENGDEWQLISFVERANRIVLFGAGNSAVYVEAFDVANGVNLLRFSTYFEPVDEAKSGKAK